MSTRKQNYDQPCWLYVVRVGDKFSKVGRSTHPEVRAEKHATNYERWLGIPRDQTRLFYKILAGDVSNAIEMEAALVKRLNGGTGRWNEETFLSPVELIALLKGIVEQPNEMYGGRAC